MVVMQVFYIPPIFIYLLKIPPNIKDFNLFKKQVLFLINSIHFLIEIYSHLDLEIQSQKEYFKKTRNILNYFYFDIEIHSH